MLTVFAACVKKVDQKKCVEFFWLRASSLWKFKVKYDVIQIQGRSVSDLTLSDIDVKNKMAWVWTTLNNIIKFSTRNWMKINNF